MMAWQLFVPLVVLLASDGSSARKEVECAYWDTTFCFYTTLAYKQARWVVEALTGPEFREDKKRVSNLKLEIASVLKIEKRYLLLPVLRRALGMSTNALFQLKVSCSGKREKPQCETGLRGLFHVTYNLVLAAMRVTVGAQLDKIDAALKRFEDLVHERNNMTLTEKIDPVHTLGDEVVNYLNITADATN